MVQRRKFLFSLFVLPLVALIKIPTFQPDRSAIAYMTEIWNTYSKGRHSLGPLNFTLSPTFFNKFESELKPIQRLYTARFDEVVAIPTLMFKAGKVTQSRWLTGDWDYVVYRESKDVNRHYEQI